MRDIEQELNELWRGYRDAVDVPEASAAFMPGIWARIDAKRAFALRFKRMSQVFAGVSAVLCMLMAGTFLMQPAANNASAPTYVDVLAAAHPTENLAAQGIVHDPSRP